MNENPASIVQVAAAWEQYVAECNSIALRPSLTGFSEWIQAQGAPPSTSEQADTRPPMHPVYYENLPINSRAGTLIWRMSRHARAYFKQLFEGMSIGSIDEFCMLDAANFLGRPTKTQLFQYDLMEVSTGTQMLARLLKQQLVEEQTNPDDRRLKHIVITPLGAQTLVEARGRMIQLGDLLFQMLPDAEIKRLEAILLRLNHHHTIIRSEAR